MQTLATRRKSSFVNSPDAQMTAMMHSLHGAIEKVVSVEYVANGKLQRETKVLENVEDFVGVDLHFNGKTTLRYSFVEWDAIKTIKIAGEVLFENPNIPPDYNPRNHRQVARMQIKCFGVEVAKQIRAKTNGDVVRELPKDLLRI